MAAGDAHIEAAGEEVAQGDTHTKACGDVHIDQRAEEDAALCTQGDAHIEGDPSLENPAHKMEGNVRVLEEDLKRLDSVDDDDCEIDHDHVQDTVGVVVLDQAGNVASTVSSGGIALKQPGR